MCYLAFACGTVVLKLVRDKSLIQKLICCCLLCPLSYLPTKKTGAKHVFRCGILVGRALVGKCRFTVSVYGV
jgi:hypothetical protein